MLLKELGYTDVIDIAFMAVLIYLVLVSFKRSRAAFVLTGMLILAAIYLVAQQFNLVLTANVFRWFFAVILFAWVVIFQEEIRRFFEQIAVWSFRRRARRRGKLHLPPEQVAVLARTLADLARDRIGALVVLPGKTMVLGYLDGGIALHGQLSEPLLKSIFDTHSEGHDGAAVIEGDVITQFGAHLPLSKNLRKLKSGGTRHAAALGLSELSDALCLVVSEERGTISAMRNGDVRLIESADALSGLMERFYNEIAPRKERGTRFRWIRHNLREKAVAVALAALLWFVQVYGSAVVYRTFRVPVEFVEPETDVAVASDPKTVNAVFSGPRRALYFLTKNDLRLVLRQLPSRRGTRTVRLTKSDMSFPNTLTLESIEPKSVSVTVSAEGGDT